MRLAQLALVQLLEEHDRADDRLGELVQEASGSGLRSGPCTRRLQLQGPR